MVIVSAIDSDLRGQPIMPVVEMMQNDVNTRIVSVRLYDNGTPLIPAADYVPVLLFGRADATGGVFDTLPDGTSAFEVTNNVVQVTMPPAVLTRAGMVNCAIAFVNVKGYRLATFPFALRIIADPSAGTTVGADYFHVTGFLPQPEDALVGGLLQVKALENGTVSQVTTLMPETISGKVKTVNGAQPDEDGNIDVASTCDLEQPRWGAGGEEMDTEYCTSYGAFDFPEYVITMTEEEYDALKTDGSVFCSYETEASNEVEYETYTQIPWDNTRYGSLECEGVGMASGLVVDSSYGYQFCIRRVRKTISPIPAEYLDLGDIAAALDHIIALQEELMA